MNDYAAVVKSLLNEISRLHVESLKLKGSLADAWDAGYEVAAGGGDETENPYREK